MHFTILPETALTAVIQRTDEEPSAITLTFHDDLVYHGHAIVSLSVRPAEGPSDGHGDPK